MPLTSMNSTRKGLRNMLTFRGTVHLAMFRLTEHDILSQPFFVTLKKELQHAKGMANVETANAEHKTVLGTAS